MKAATGSPSSRTLRLSCMPRCISWGHCRAKRLTTLRQFGGLQAYPSRTKDADVVDFSTGSVGLGAIAPSFAALTQRYAQAHFGATTSNRFIAVSGDAELDEGNIWEAIIDGALQDIPNSLWVIDLNRQSLDRVVPGVRAAQLKALFADSGWQVIEAKYGVPLERAFARAGGAAFRECIDDMCNEEYQRLIREDGPTIRAKLLGKPGAKEIARCLSCTADDELPVLLANLGGHDLRTLLGAFEAAEQSKGRPSVIFAYTIKGWRLPIAADPFNHSALLSHSRMEELREALHVDADTPWGAFSPGSEEGRLVSRSRGAPGAGKPPCVPAGPSPPRIFHTSSRGTGRRLQSPARRPSAERCSASATFRGSARGW